MKFPERQPGDRSNLAGPRLGMKVLPEHPTIVTIAKSSEPTDTPVLFDHFGQLAQTTTVLWQNWLFQISFPTPNLLGPIFRVGFKGSLLCGVRSPRQSVEPGRDKFATGCNAWAKMEHRFTVIILPSRRKRSSRKKGASDRNVTSFPFACTQIKTICFNRVGAVFARSTPPPILPSLPHPQRFAKPTHPQPPSKPTPGETLRILPDREPLHQTGPGEAAGQNRTPPIASPTLFARRSPHRAGTQPDHLAFCDGWTRSHIASPHDVRTDLPIEAHSMGPHFASVQCKIVSNRVISKSTDGS